MLNAARVVARSGLGLGLRRSTRWSASLPGCAAASGRASSGHAQGQVSRALERSCVVEPGREERFCFGGLTDDREPAEADRPPRRSGPELQAQSLIGFQFPSKTPADKKMTKKKKKKAERAVFGTPDGEEPASDSACSGCGAALHCAHQALPGYLPSEKYRVLLREGRLDSATCQRCHLLRHHQKALGLQVSKDDFRRVVRSIRRQRALVLLIADLLDVPDSLPTDLPDLVGANKSVLVLGNKVDLLPADSPDYLRRICRQLGRWCQDAGFGPQVSRVHLISAKTGYGVEGLISELQRSWKYKGDVYLVGSANAGKSTLFNALLRSDYCKSRAADVLAKATVSPWPGTTLNLLKFPIVNPTPYRMFRRQRRLRESCRPTEDRLPLDELEGPADIRRRGYLVGHVGRTFLAKAGQAAITFDPDALASGEREDGATAAAGEPDEAPGELTRNELKDAHWLFDTPGIAKERDILHLLDEQEVKAVAPARGLVPRTFVLKAGMSLFVGALARIDFLEGQKSCWFSVMASGRVPLHVSSVEKADALYQKHAGRELLGVPAGGAARMKDFPALAPRDFRLEGRGDREAAADITLSSAGWVAVTVPEGQLPLLRLHGPPSAGFGLRTPPLLPGVISLKGARIPKSPAYKAPALLSDGSLRRRPDDGKKERRTTARR